MFLNNLEFQKKTIEYILEKEKIHEVARILKINGVKSKLYTTSYFVPNKNLSNTLVPLINIYEQEI